MWLTALANVLPALADAAKTVLTHDDKAATAARVAADPNAPPDVKQAAANVAGKAIDDSAKAQKAALGQAAGKAPSSDIGAGMGMVIALGLGLFLMGKRRR